MSKYSGRGKNENEGSGTKWRIMKKIAAKTAYNATGIYIMQNTMVRGSGDDQLRKNIKIIS